MQPKYIANSVPLKSIYRFNDGRSKEITRGRWPTVLFNHSGWPLIRGDHIKPNPHSYKYVRSQGEGTYIRVYGSYTDISEICGPEAGSLPPYTAPWAYNEALGKLVDAMRGGLDVSVDAFQSKQTAKQFDAIDKFTQFAKGLKGRSRGNVRLLASLWLELQYGWKPLIGSVYDAYDESFRHILNKTSTYKGRYTSRSNDLVKCTDASSMCQVASQRKGRHSVQIEVTIDHSKEIDIGRWTSLNPMSIGWELLPYSFVVDWFIDVGSYLRNAETALLYSRAFRSGFVSTLLHSKYTGATWAAPYGPITWSGEAEYCQFSRTLLTGFPTPTRPIVRADLNATRLLNAAGLLAQYIEAPKGPRHSRGRF